MLPMQSGDVERTWAGVSDLTQDFGYKSNTSIEKGVSTYIDWYRGII